jgi:2-methylcitrate dehydratase PrpD
MPSARRQPVRGTFAHWGTLTIKSTCARGALSGLLAALLAGAGIPVPERSWRRDGGFNAYSDGGNRKRRRPRERWSLRPSRFARGPRELWIQTVSSLSY